MPNDPSRRPSAGRPEQGDSDEHLYPTGFKTALRNVEPQRKIERDDAHNARLAYAAVRDVLKADPKLRDTLGIKPKLIGSYARDVSIRRVKDVDVFCRLTTAPEGLTPGQAMIEFERVLEAEYDKRCTRQHWSFKIDFDDLSVDVVPAKPCGEHWQVPSRDPEGQRGAWVDTNRLLLNELAPCPERLCAASLAAARDTRIRTAAGISQSASLQASCRADVPASDTADDAV